MRAHWVLLRPRWLLLGLVLLVLQVAFDGLAAKPTYQDLSWRWRLRRHPVDLSLPADHEFVMPLVTSLIRIEGLDQRTFPPQRLVVDVQIDGQVYVEGPRTAAAQLFWDEVIKLAGGMYPCLTPKRVIEEITR